MSNGDLEHAGASPLSSEKSPADVERATNRAATEKTEPYNEKAALDNNSVAPPSIISISTTPTVAIPDEKTVTSRWELNAYYLYYVGNNGLAGFNFGPSAFQNLLYLAATCDANNSCTLPLAGSRKTGMSPVSLHSSSIVLMLAKSLGMYSTPMGYHSPYRCASFRQTGVNLD